MNFSGAEDEDEHSEDDFRVWEVIEMPSRDDLLPILECPVCFDLPFPPIRTCYQGHIICADCCRKLSGCPLCQKPIGYGRNFFAEDFVNKSTMYCKYREDGCTLVSNGANIKIHLSQCNFRPKKCPYCPKRISFGDIEHHFWIQHKISKWDLNEEGISILQLEICRRRGGNEFTYVTPNMRVISTGLLIKFLLTLTAISFFADQFILNFYSSHDLSDL